MRLTCPACGAVASLDALLGADAARSVLLQALERDALGRALVRYLALWRPEKRALSWERTANLLGEIMEWIDAGRVERHGRLWPAPRDYWIAAIDEMVARRDAGSLRTPLKSHGYLLEILAGMGDRAEARAERDGEDRLAGRTPVAAVSDQQSAKPLPPGGGGVGEKGKKPRNPQAAVDAIAKAKSILHPKAGRDAGATPKAGRDAGAT